MATETTQWIMALNHPARRRILRAVKEAGGASAPDLCRHCDLSLSAVSYHVKVLVDLQVLTLTSPRAEAKRARSSQPVVYDAHASGGGATAVASAERRRGGSSRR